MLNNTIRSFLAVEITESDKQRLNRLQQAIARDAAAAIRWLPADSFHITLCFLGNLAVTLIPALMSQIKAALAACTGTFIDLNALEYFPSAEHPAAIALIPARQDPLVPLAAALTDAANQCGLKTEDRPLRAHLTLARIKRNPNPLPPLPALQPIANLAIHKISLFQSLGQLRYQALDSIILPPGRP